MNRTVSVSLGASASTTRRLQRASVFSVGLLIATSPYASGGGVAPSVNSRNLKTFLPHSSVPIAGSDGRMSDVWYRFFDFFANQFLDLKSGVTLLDLKSAVNNVQTISIQAMNSAAATDQQVAQNAAVVQVITQVAQNANLPGAQAIPPITLIRTKFGDPNAN